MLVTKTTRRPGRTLQLLGLPIQDTTLPKAAESIILAAKERKPLNVAFINAHCVNEAKTNKLYRRSLSAFDILFADGIGMKIAAQASGQTLVDNVNGTDLFPVLCEEAAESGVSIFLLGAQKGRAEDAGRRMAMLYPGLNIAGTHHGFFNTDEEEDAVIRMINASGAQMLFVALGVPLQERWIQRNRHRLQPSVVLGVGGLFDYYSGAIPRAPAPWRRHGLEWAWRLAQEPQRLWQRYVIGNARFMARLAWIKVIGDDRIAPNNLALSAAGTDSGSSVPEQTGIPTPAAPQPAPRQRRISRRIYEDVASAACVAGPVVAVWSLLPSFVPEASQRASILPAYAVLLFALYRQLNFDVFSRLRQSDVDGLAYAHLLSAGLAIGLNVLAAGQPLNLHAAISWLLTSFTAGLLTLYAVKRFTWSDIVRPLLGKRIAVFGAGPIVVKIYEEIAQGKVEAEFSGLYEDRKQPRIANCGIPISGTFNDLVQKAKDGEIDEVLLALPQSANKRMRSCAHELSALPVTVYACTHIASDYPGRYIRELQTSMLGSIGLLQIRENPLRDWRGALKRLEDIVIGGVLSIVTLPLMALIALAIKIEGGGPVFFPQTRGGFNGRDFVVYKFRTMTTMDNGAVVQQASRGDRRVTRVGAFLRRFSLDELPQLWNVLKGDMSFVGPRPHAQAHDEFYSAIIRRYANRYQVRPGLTGLAQVRGFRGETTNPRMMSKRIQNDLWYIENWSLLLDLKIILLTPFACLFTKAAY